MAFIFFIVFIAAMIGMFRPYKFLPQGKRWHYGLAAFLSFMAIGVTAPEQSSNDESATAENSGDATSADNSEESPEALAEAPRSKWRYDTQRDEMRGDEARFATVDSENTVQFDFPYGEQTAAITVRQDPEYGLDVIFSVPSGQILCHGFGDSYLNVKFDDGPIRRFNCTRASDGSSEVSFISSPQQFLTALRSADRTVIEAEFYQAGRQQYVFDTHGLEWEN